MEDFLILLLLICTFEFLQWPYFFCDWKLKSPNVNTWVGHVFCISEETVESSCQFIITLKLALSHKCLEPVWVAVRLEGRLRTRWPVRENRHKGHQQRPSPRQVGILSLTLAGLTLANTCGSREGSSRKPLVLQWNGHWQLDQGQDSVCVISSDFRVYKMQHGESAISTNRKKKAILNTYLKIKITKFEANTQFHAFSKHSGCWVERECDWWWFWEGGGHSENMRWRIHSQMCEWHWAIRAHFPKCPHFISNPRKLLTHEDSVWASPPL